MLSFFSKRVKKRGARWCSSKKFLRAISKNFLSDFDLSYRRFLSSGTRYKRWKSSRNCGSFLFTTASVCREHGREIYFRFLQKDDLCGWAEILDCVFPAAWSKVLYCFDLVWVLRFFSLRKNFLEAFFSSLVKHFKNVFNVRCH